VYVCEYRRLPLNYPEPGRACFAGIIMYEPSLRSRDENDHPRRMVAFAFSTLIFLHEFNPNWAPHQRTSHGRLSCPS
jgi:hypothetical protein